MAKGSEVTKLYPYIDRGTPGLRYQRGGALILMEHSPVPVAIRRLKLEELRRRNSLEPELQDVNRIFLRWSEREGSGLPDPEADIRETHYDPLPLALQERVTVIVNESPWQKFIRKLYSSTLKQGSLAEQLGISRSQLNIKRSNALWFFKGRFQSEGISLLAAPSKVRANFDLW